MKSCAYGEVTREMVEEIKNKFDKTDAKIDKLDVRMTELFNHQSSRLPMWATVLITLLSSLCTGLIIKLVA